MAISVKIGIRNHKNALSDRMTSSTFKIFSDFPIFAPKRNFLDSSGMIFHKKIFVSFLAQSNVNSL